MSVVAKRSPISSTAEHLFNYFVSHPVLGHCTGAMWVGLRSRDCS